MSIDSYSLVRVALYFVALGIVALGLFRAIQMGRGFVNRLYRGRAFWTAAVMLVFIVVLSVTSIYGNGAGLVGLIPFIMLVLVLFVFADRTIQVAIEMDFFHRNTFHWRQVRRLLYVVLLADSFYGIFGEAYAGLTQSSPGVFPLVFFNTITVAFVVVIIAVAISAGRAPDRTIKRHVRLFGVFLAALLVALFTSQPGIGPAVNVASDLIIVAATYSLYLMVMSLSLVGKMEKGEASEQRRSSGGLAPWANIKP